MGSSKEKSRKKSSVKGKAPTREALSVEEFRGESRRIDDQWLQESCLFAPFWYVDELTDSVIEIKNNLSEELTVRVVLRTEDGGTLALPDLVMPPLGWVSERIRARLPSEWIAGRGKPSAFWGDGSRAASRVGSAYLMPVSPLDNGSGNVCGWIRIENPTERLGILSTFETLTYVVSPTALHCIWWLSFPDCKAHFSIQNASVIPVELAVDFEAESFSGSSTLVIPPLGSKTIDLAGILAPRKIPKMGGITLRAQHRSPGDVGLNRVVARGRVIQQQLGFATSLRFHERGSAASVRPGGEVHAPVAYFGRLSKLLPRSKMVLHPHALLRNVGDRPITIEISAYGKDFAGQSVTLEVPRLTLAPQRATEIDLEEMRQLSFTPLGDGPAGVRIRHDGYSTDLVTELINVEEQGHFAWYDATKRLPLFQATRQLVVSFSLAEGSDPFLFLKNMTDEPQLPRVVLDYADGSKQYHVSVPLIAPQETITIDIRRLRNERVADRAGKLLPDDLESGQAAVFHESGAIALSDPTFVSARPGISTAVVAESSSPPAGSEPNGLGGGEGEPWFPPSCGRGGVRDPDDGRHPRITNVKVWLNVLIPRDVPGLTISRPNHPGETMIKPSLLGGANRAITDCFSTDQRTFSSFINASSRVHAEVSIEPDNAGAFIERINAGQTHQIDCDNGNEKCADFAHVDRVHFRNAAGSRATGITINLDGSVHVPCVTLAVWFGDIDFTGTLSIQFSAADPSTATVSFNGFIEPFPAYEMYATANDGAGVPLFQVPSIPGAGPADIAGLPNRPISGSATIQAR